jgi:hypothetical protein
LPGAWIAAKDKVKARMTCYPLGHKVFDIERPRRSEEWFPAAIALDQHVLQ